MCEGYVREGHPAGRPGTQMPTRTSHFYRLVTLVSVRVKYSCFLHINNSQSHHRANPASTGRYAVHDRPNRGGYVATRTSWLTSIASLPPNPRPFKRFMLNCNAKKTTLYTTLKVDNWVNHECINVQRLSADSHRAHQTVFAELHLYNTSLYTSACGRS